MRRNSYVDTPQIRAIEQQQRCRDVPEEHEWRPIANSIIQLQHPTPEAIRRIVGDGRLTDVHCSVCEENVEAAIVIEDCGSFCEGCLREALRLLTGAE